MIIIYLTNASADKVLFKDAVFDTTKKPSPAHNLRKGLEIKGFRGFDVLRIIASGTLFLFIQLVAWPGM